MRIEQGFGKFTLGEEVEVELLQIKYTKQNHRPYAVVDAGEGRFNVNIKDSDTTLKQGRYKIVCTGVNPQGFCYINLEKLQHFSWDKHDEATQDLDQMRCEKVEETRNDNSVDIAFSINLTRHYKDRLKYHSPSVYEHIDAILKELYQYYGELVIEEMEVEDVEFS